MMEEPRTLASLRARIRNEARKRQRQDNTIERLVANVVVGQLLPPGVIKGGTALKVRLGDAQTRFSRDLDAARRPNATLDDYIDELDRNLRHGWHQFSGVIRSGTSPVAPPDVPPEYVMRPFKVSLSYKGSAWVTIDLELGRDEVGSSAAPELRISEDIVALFADVGLPAPDPIPLLQIDHQIAQKLHACTWVGDGAGNERAHDLVDLQVIVREENPDLAAAGVTAARLFAARGKQAWKPVVVAYDRWDSIYADAAAGLDVLPTVEEAVRWANEDLIGKM